MTGPENLGFEIALDVPFEQAIARVTDALKVEGFGVLTRIDVHSTLKEKIGATFRPYAILGVCNPPIAHRALLHDGRVGLLLPCNVTVEESGPGRSLARIGDPQALMAVGGMERDEVMQGVAQEARSRLMRAVDALRGA
jgi:uncharacterized protein (DUF302 family)